MLVSVHNIPVNVGVCIADICLPMQYIVVYTANPWHAPNHTSVMFK